MPEQIEPDPAPAPPTGGRADRPPADLARQLTGALPCISCRYDLRGMSVRSVCPECGIPVRATILATVDPYARVLRPLYRPRITAAGLMLWSTAALLAALFTWGLRLADTYAVFADALPPRLPQMALMGAACIALSGIGAMVLIRPHAGIPVWQTVLAAAGVLATFLLAYLYWRLHGWYDLHHTPPYVAGEASGRAARSWMRLEITGVLAFIILTLRLNARLLASRSLLLRMGRVDRQTMLAMTAVLGLAAVGDVLHVVADSARGGGLAALDHVADPLIAVASMLLTLGLAGVLIDCRRIAPVLMRPSLSIGEIVSDPEPPRGGAPGGVHP